MVINQDTTPNDNEKLETMRHSAAHIMAEAVLSIFPDARFGIGPATDNGFYYDFELPRPLSPEEFLGTTSRLNFWVPSLEPSSAANWRRSWELTTFFL